MLRSQRRRQSGKVCFRLVRHTQTGKKKKLLSIILNRYLYFSTNEECIKRSKKKELHNDDPLIVRQAVTTLGELLVNPEKLMEAVKLNIVDRCVYYTVASLFESFFYYRRAYRLSRVRFECQALSSTTSSLSFEIYIDYIKMPKITAHIRRF